MDEIASSPRPHHGSSQRRYRSAITNPDPPGVAISGAGEARKTRGGEAYLSLAPSLSQKSTYFFGLPLLLLAPMVWLAAVTPLAAFHSYPSAARFVTVAV